jgi:hypothetical protein
MSEQLGIYDTSEQALEKQASRDADARALASGEKTLEQLHKENGLLAFPPEQTSIEFDPAASLRL